MSFKIFDRPGVAGADLQTSLWFIQSLTESSFVKISSKHHLSQTIRARDLTFWKNVHISIVTFHISHVTWQIKRKRNITIIFRKNSKPWLINIIYKYIYINKQTNNPCIHNCTHFWSTKGAHSSRGSREVEACSQIKFLFKGLPLCKPNVDYGPLTRVSVVTIIWHQLPYWTWDGIYSR